MIPVVSIVGFSNSGKTTFVVKLVAELKRRGFRVAVIKHHHQPVEIDVPGKDTWRHAKAGADIVVSASPGMLAVMEKTEPELSLDEITRKISGVDLIITEGFKKEKKPKIEVFRSGVHDTLISPPDELLAVVTDAPLEGIPTYGLDDAAGVAGFLQEKFFLATE